MRGPTPPPSPFFGRGPAAVSPSLPAPVDSASGDPMPDPSGEGGGIGSPRRSSPGSGASSLRSRTRARPRGLSIVLGSSVRLDSTRRGRVSCSAPSLALRQLTPSPLFDFFSFFSSSLASPLIHPAFFYPHASFPLCPLHRHSRRTLSASSAFVSRFRELNTLLSWWGSDVRSNAS